MTQHHYKIIGHVVEAIDKRVVLEIVPIARRVQQQLSSPFVQLHIENIPPPSTYRMANLVLYEAVVCSLPDNYEDELFAQITPLVGSSPHYEELHKANRSGWPLYWYTGLHPLSTMMEADYHRNIQAEVWNLSKAAPREVREVIIHPYQGHVHLFLPGNQQKNISSAYFSTEHCEISLDAGNKIIIEPSPTTSAMQTIIWLPAHVISSPC